MKDSFFGFYPPSADEYKRLWDEALIVLDTNVLLSLYRFPSVAREEMLSVLDIVKERIWIPYQVALEFQRNRLTVISTERKNTEEALNTAEKFVSEIKERVKGLQIDRHGIEIEITPLLDNLEVSKNSIVDAIKLVHERQLDINSADPIRDKIDKLLASKVGKGPKSQEDLDSLIADGETRFQLKIPPGFADSEKDKNPNEAIFSHDNINYQRKFGDLILWRQLIEHAKANKINSVILVTADRKEDWWWREFGKTLGPHPELTRELKKEAGVDLFWMYSSVQFLENAKKYVKEDVSEAAVEELREAVLEDTKKLPWDANSINAFWRARKSRRLHEAESDLLLPIINWLLNQRGGEIIENNGYPDILRINDEEVSGYEIIKIKNNNIRFLNNRIRDAVIRAYAEKAKGELTEMHIIVALDEGGSDYIRNYNNIDLIYKTTNRVINEYPITSVVTGYYTAGREFSPIFEIKGDQ